MQEHNVSETGYVFIPGEGWETPTVLGPVERASLNHWISDYVVTESNQEHLDKA
jgi:hypothetical protein